MSGVEIRGNDKKGYTVSVFDDKGKITESHRADNLTAVRRITDHLVAELIIKERSHKHRRHMKRMVE